MILRWCRAELWCRLLSNKFDTSVVVVYTPTEAEFMFPLDWQHNSTVDGNIPMPTLPFALKSDVPSQTPSQQSLVEYIHRFRCTFWMNPPPPTSN